jgi:ABC-type branched-subunit amino acid transport system substrate-binding protein
MYESYNDTDKDFTALINKMKQGKIDIIVLGGYHTAGRAADQAVARAGLRRARWSASMRSRTPSSASWAAPRPTAC